MSQGDTPSLHCEMHYSTTCLLIIILLPRVLGSGVGYIFLVAFQLMLQIKVMNRWYNKKRKY